MSAPFASAPVASPNGAKVAWLENEQGKRNVYVAAAPDWKAKRITNFAKDDGEEIAQLAWAPDGSYLLFVRGGDLETGGDNPNPEVSAVTPEQEIWSAAADGSAVKKLTVGNGPAISPKRRFSGISQGRTDLQHAAQRRRGEKPRHAKRLRRRSALVARRAIAGVYHHAAGSQLDQHLFAGGQSRCVIWTPARIAT